MLNSVYESCRWLPQSWCGSYGYWLGNIMLKALTWTDCETLKGRQSSRGAHHVRRLIMMQVCFISVAALWTAAVRLQLLSPRYHCLSRSVLSFPAHGCSERVALRTAVQCMVMRYLSPFQQSEVCANTVVGRRPNYIRNLPLPVFIFDAPNSAEA